MKGNTIDYEWAVAMQERMATLEHRMARILERLDSAEQSIRALAERAAPPAWVSAP